MKTQGFEMAECNRFWPLIDLDPGAISDLAVWLWANELTSLSPHLLNGNESISLVLLL